MLAALHDRDFKAPFAQVLGHLQPDEAGAHDGGAPRLLAVDEVGDCVGILDGAQREQAPGIDAGKVGRHGAGAGGQDQLVVALDVLGAVVQATHGDGAGGAVDGDDLLAHAGIDVEAVAEALRCLRVTFGAIGDGTADVVGQAAGGVFHKAGALDHDDLGVLIQTAQTGRGGCSSGDAADDDDFHDWVPFGEVHADGGRRGGSLACQRTGPTADTAHVHDIGIPLALEFAHRLCTAGAGEAVGEDGRILVGQAFGGGCGDGDQRDAHGTLDVTVAVLIRGADIDHDAAGRLARLGGKLVEAGAEKDAGEDGHGGAFRRCAGRIARLAVRLTPYAPALGTSVTLSPCPAARPPLSRGYNGQVQAHPKGPRP